MNLTLVYVKTDGTQTELPVKKPRLVIGRKESCDVRVTAAAVSREHCEIRVDGERAIVKDLGSSNGTFVNAKRITEQPLNAGDVIVVGPMTWVVRVNGLPREIDRGAVARAEEGISAPSGGKASATAPTLLSGPGKRPSTPPAAPASAPAKSARGDDSDMDLLASPPKSDMGDSSEFDFDFNLDDEDEDEKKQPKL